MQSFQTSWKRKPNHFEKQMHIFRLFHIQFGHNKLYLKTEIYYFKLKKVLPFIWEISKF